MEAFLIHVSYKAKGEKNMIQKTHMKSLLKLVSCLGIALMMVFSMAPVLGAAEQAEAATDVPGGSDAFAFEGNTNASLKNAAKDYPDAFDLRNVDGKSYITPVKIQNPYGTCWGFAAIASAESSILASGLADPETLDLSEKHLAYFSTSYIDDPDNPQNGEGIHFKNVSSEYKRTSAHRYNIGGIPLIATSLFASGIGPNQEDRTDLDTGDSLKDLFAYKGANGEKVSRRVAIAYDENDNPVDYGQRALWYSSDDDWSIPDKYRFYQSYRLKDSFILPSPCELDENTGEYTHNRDGIDAIKQQMYENHRAVTISFRAESYLPGQDTSGKLFMSSKWAHYTNEPSGSNHAVTIVGWDDNYPKENFLEGKQPPENGAFLIKNSWGAETNGGFENNGYRHWGLLDGLDGIPYSDTATAKSDRATGYFWISYYDQSLNDPESFEFDKPTGDNGYYIEQHDYLQVNEIEKKKLKGSRLANVFTAEATSKLSEISVMTVTPETNVEYEIYLLGNDYDDPEDGLKLADGSASFDYGGYHRITIPEEGQKVLAKGQKYAVIVKETSKEGDYIPYATMMITGSGGLSEGVETENKAVINKGESFFVKGGKWTDLSTKAARKTFLENSGDYTTMDNFQIKSYLEPVTYEDGGEDKVFEGYLTINNYGQGTINKLNFITGRDMVVAPEFRGIKNDMPEDWDPEFTWDSSDPAVAEIEPVDNGAVKITGKKAGKSFVTLDAGEFGRRVICVQVRNPKLIYMALGYDDFKMVYTGKALKPKPVVLEDETTSEAVQHKYKEGVDYEMSYKNNVNAGKATATVTGIGNYAGKVSVKFTILKAKNTMKAGGKTATVSAAKLKKKAQTLKRTAVLKISKKKGALTFVKKSGNKKIRIAKKTGKVTVKKGLKKGTYTVKVRVRAAGTKNYKALTKTVPFRIRVR